MGGALKLYGLKIRRRGVKKHQIALTSGLKPFADGMLNPVKKIKDEINEQQAAPWARA